MKSASDRTIRIQYTAVQFVFWMTYLIISSFAAVILSGRGFSATKIGYVTTAGALLTIVFQTSLSSLADRSDRVSVKQILAVLLLLSGLTAAVLWLFPGLRAVSFAGMFLAIGFLNAATPLLISLCLQYNGKRQRIDFGVARSVGSLGYALAGYVMGSIADRLGSEIILVVLCVLCVFLFLLLSRMETPPKQSAAEGTDSGEKANSLARFLAVNRRYDVFLGGVILFYFMPMMFSTYLIYFARYYGGGPADMGKILSVSAFFEMPAVALAVTLMKRFKPEQLLRVSAAAGIVKIGLMLFITDIRWLIGIQTLQFFHSGLHMMAAVYFADAIVGKEDAVKAQSIQSVALTGISAVAANIAGGYMLEHLPMKAVIGVGVASSILAAVFLFIATSSRIFGESGAGIPE